MLNMLYILLAILFVLLNGFFVAAEFAMVRLRHTRVQAIKASQGMRGKILAKIHEQLDTYLSACQLGITLASLGLGWIGEPAFADILEPLFHHLHIFSDTTITAISFIIAFFVISYLHIVLGELAPKSWAIRQSQSVSLWTAIPLYFFYALMYPFIWILNHSANYILKLFGSTAGREDETFYTSDELKLIVGSGYLQAGLEKEEAEILDNVLDFADLTVADIMRPAEEMISINLKNPIATNLQLMAQHHFSRYPVYDEYPQKIIGILHVKDIFSLTQQQPVHDLHEVVRPVLSIHLDLQAIDLFRQFRQGLAHFAVVINSGGSVVGFITLDNILNAILGDISDEFVKTKPDLILAKDGSWIMKGNTPLYVLEKALNIEFTDEDSNTIAGLIMSKLERLPQLNETIHFDYFDVLVIKMNQHRILLVKIFPKQLAAKKD